MSETLSPWPVVYKSLEQAKKIGVDEVRPTRPSLIISRERGEFRKNKRVSCSAWRRRGSPSPWRRRFPPLRGPTRGAPMSAGIGSWNSAVWEKTEKTETTRLLPEPVPRGAAAGCGRLANRRAAERRTFCLPSLRETARVPKRPSISFNALNAK